LARAKRRRILTLHPLTPTLSPDEKLSGEREPTAVAVGERKPAVVAGERQTKATKIPRR
jgi:hypothetical protein